MTKSSIASAILLQRRHSPGARRRPGTSYTMPGPSGRFPKYGGCRLELAGLLVDSTLSCRPSLLQFKHHLPTHAWGRAAVLAAGKQADRGFLSGPPVTAPGPVTLSPRLVSLRSTGTGSPGSAERLFIQGVRPAPLLPPPCRVPGWTGRSVAPVNHSLCSGGHVLCGRDRSSDPPSDTWVRRRLTGTCRRAGVPGFPYSGVLPLLRMTGFSLRADRNCPRGRSRTARGNSFELRWDRAAEFDSNARNLRPGPGPEIRPLLAALLAGG